MKKIIIAISVFVAVAALGVFMAQNWGKRSAVATAGSFENGYGRGNSGESGHAWGKNRGQEHGGFLSENQACGDHEGRAYEGRGQRGGGKGQGWGQGYGRRMNGSSDRENHL